MNGSLKSNMTKVLYLLQEMTDELQEDTAECTAKYNEIIEKRMTLNMNEGMARFRELLVMQNDVELRTKFQGELMDVVKKFTEEYFAA